LAGIPWGIEDMVGLLLLFKGGFCMTKELLLFPKGSGTKGTRVNVPSERGREVSRSGGFIYRNRFTDEEWNTFCKRFNLEHIGRKNYPDVSFVDLYGSADNGVIVHCRKSKPENRRYAGMFYWVDNPDGDGVHHAAWEFGEDMDLTEIMENAVFPSSAGELFTKLLSRNDVPYYCTVDPRHVFGTEKKIDWETLLEKFSTTGSSYHRRTAYWKKVLKLVQEEVDAAVSYSPKNDIVMGSKGFISGEGLCTVIGLTKCSVTFKTVKKSDRGHRTSYREFDKFFIPAEEMKAKFGVLFSRTLKNLLDPGIMSAILQRKEYTGTADFISCKMLSTKSVNNYFLDGDGISVCASMYEPGDCQTEFFSPYGSYSEVPDCADNFCTDALLKLVITGCPESRIAEVYSALGFCKSLKSSVYSLLGQEDRGMVDCSLIEEAEENCKKVLKFLGENPDKNE